jgi:hypothetical protein
MLLACGESIHRRMWQPASTAPSDRDIELAVIDPVEVHALVFSCRRTADGWVKEATGERIEVHPTHWREWTERGSLPRPVLPLRGPSQGRQLRLFLGEQSEDYLSLGFVRLPFKEMTKVLDVEVRHRPVHGRSLHVAPKSHGAKSNPPPVRSEAQIAL